MDDPDSVLVSIDLGRCELLSPAERQKHNLPDSGLLVHEHTLSRKLMRVEFDAIQKAVAEEGIDAGFKLYIHYMVDTVRSAPRRSK